MVDPNPFSKLVPGFDFLQGLVKNAGAALPAIGQWVAPTLDPAELEKRISELRTIQFWLEQNARMLGATIQALEVQRMTLSTLRTMNVQMGDLRESMKIRMPTAAAPAPAPEPAPAPATPPPEPAGEAATPPNIVDPMQWWGALTRQFTDLASSALTETANEAAKTMASAITKPPAAAQTDEAPATEPEAPAEGDAEPAAKAAAKTAAPRKRPAAK
jgi:hypothetical protein